MDKDPNNYIMTCKVPWSQWVILAGLILASVSCTYRFTNVHIAVPRGIQTIAIENIYDTSGEVIPHYLLWESLQREFAKDGHLRLVSQGRADAVLVAHISEATVRPIGNSLETEPDKDIGVDQSPPPHPSSFRTLAQAGEFTRRDQLDFRVNIQIVELYSRDVIFQKSYSGSRQFRTARSEQSVAEKKSHFLLYEEALRAKFGEISNSIASNVVRDFIVGR